MIYNVAWAIALLKGYESLDEMLDSWCRELLQMYANGRASFELDEIDYSLKPGREYQIREEKEEEQEQEKEKEKRQQ